MDLTDNKTTAGKKAFFFWNETAQNTLKTVFKRGVTWLASVSAWACSPFSSVEALLARRLSNGWYWRQRAAMLLEYVRRFRTLTSVSTIDAFTVVLRQEVTSNGSVGSSFCIIGENDIFFLQRHLNFTASKSTLQCEDVPAKEWQLHRVNRRIQHIVKVHFQSFKILIASREFVFNYWLVQVPVQNVVWPAENCLKKQVQLGFVQINDNVTADSCPGRWVGGPPILVSNGNVSAAKYVVQLARRARAQIERYAAALAAESLQHSHPERGCSFRWVRHSHLFSFSNVCITSLTSQNRRFSAGAKASSTSIWSHKRQMNMANSKADGSLWLVTCTWKRQHLKNYDNWKNTTIKHKMFDCRVWKQLLTFLQNTQRLTLTFQTESPQNEKVEDENSPKKSTLNSVPRVILAVFGRILMRFFFHLKSRWNANVVQLEIKKMSSREFSSDEQLCQIWTLPSCSILRSILEMKQRTQFVKQPIFYTTL